MSHRNVLMNQIKFFGQWKRILAKTYRKEAYGPLGMMCPVIVKTVIFLID